MVLQLYCMTVSSRHLMPEPRVRLVATPLAASRVVISVVPWMTF